MNADQIKLTTGQLAMLQKIHEIQGDLAQHRKLVCGPGPSALVNSLHPGRGKLTCANVEYGEVEKLLQLKLVVPAPRATSLTARYEVSRRGKAVLQQQLQLA